MINSRLSPVALGLSLGVVWGIALLITGLVAHFYAYGKVFVTAVGSLYLGYGPTILGSFIGGLIGFIDAFIMGLIIAWLYNLFAGCCGRHECISQKEIK